jgi:hypothetical protein
MNQHEVFASNPVIGCLYRVRHRAQPRFTNEAVLVKLANGKPVCCLGNGKYLIAGSGERVFCPNLVVFEPGVVGRYHLYNPDLTVWLEKVEEEEE